VVVRVDQWHFCRLNCESDRRTAFLDFEELREGGREGRKEGRSVLVVWFIGGVVMEGLEGGREGGRHKKDL